MPLSPKPPCREPGCPILGCQVHARPAWGHARPVKRVTGRTLQRLRMELWLKDPRCQACKRVVALNRMVRDHVVPLAEAGIDEPNNENAQVLCVDCSRKKTEQEALRGRMRSR
jgi:5-methylcytosine-specific restriction endonuclease McrA